jgi:hypothetical protein
MTLAEIVTAVTGLMEDYIVFISAGAVIGLAAFLLRRLAKGIR